MDVRWRNVQTRPHPHVHNQIDSLTSTCRQNSLSAAFSSGELSPFTVPEVCHQLLFFKYFQCNADKFGMKKDIPRRDLCTCIDTYIEMYVYRTVLFIIQTNNTYMLV